MFRSLLPLILFTSVTGSLNAQTVTDFDGNVYPTVVIGAQEWMQKNLKVTHYNNGDPIPHIVDNATWYAATSGAYAYYYNDTANLSTYGALYNGFVVQDVRGVCPTGWHVPVDNEWRLLFRTICETGDCDSIWADNMLFSGNEGTNEGGKMKESGTDHWNSPNEGADNSSGFTALPHGYRFWDGDYYTMNEYGVFWANTEHEISVNMWFYAPYASHAYIYHGYGDKLNGFGIRCVRPASQSSVIENAPKLPQLYPNPTSGILSVKTDLEVYDKLTIFDISGKICGTVELSQENETIDISGLDNGMYTLVFESSNHWYSTRVSKQ